jgi:4-hydroxybenzoate polyprenyltransferase
MAVQFLKSAGLSAMTMQTGTPSTKKRRIPWYVYFLGASIYTALGGWLASESSPLAIICIVSAPIGFFYAWRAWKQEKRGKG